MYKIKNEPFLNKAINYIASNMTEHPSLEEVSAIASFSPFHFHRLFKEFTGETLSEFTRRIRLEKSAFLLIFEEHRTVTDIALTCGYSSSQSFNKAFKKHFGMNTKMYKIKENTKERKIIFFDKENTQNYTVSVNYLKEFDIAYNRNFGAYNNIQTHKFQKSSKQRYPDKEFIGVCWDDPEVTKDEHCRYDTGYIVEKSERAHQELIIETIEEATYALLQINIKEGDFESAWEYLLYDWLPKHAYVPKRVFCFEKILEFPNSQNNFTHKAELYIPIKKL